ncbi:cytochrome P450 [Amycolatopsis sp. NPDC023774]|uniref:cytochrome P450 family protein n=1 Tax=Amycolatopsis sp. NPDC023774 TaxID=3155015 RepID=UPI0033F180D0
MTTAEKSFALPAGDEPLPQTYARLREAGPVVPVRLPGDVPVWAVTTHAAVQEVLSGDDSRFGKHSSHWRALRDGEVPEGWPFLPLVYGEHMLMRDGAEHRRLRALVSRDFTPGRVEALRPRIEEVVEQLVADIAARTGTVDLIAAFAEQLPMVVICELFGIPEPERPRLRTWTQALFSHQSTPEDNHRAATELVGYLGTLIQRKREHPEDDLASAMVRGTTEERLDDRELVDSLFLMLIAGHETTVHLLGHAIVHLLADPAQLDLAVRGRRWHDVVEETLRLTPPVYGSLFRYALADTTVAGTPIAAGDALLLCLGGAGTDPQRHGPDAARFDLTRTQRGHLAFGHGPHFCLGAPLARLEANVALPILFDRLSACGWRCRRSSCGTARRS